MSENSKIEWCDHTFNPWEGCQKVGPGCDNCYAESRNARFSGGQAVNWGPGAPRRRTSRANWGKPLAWNRGAGEFFAEHGRRQRVFCASLADIFDNEVNPQWRRDLFDLIELTPNLDWLLLTKRVGNVVRMLPTHDWAARANVWLGATIVNQEEADRDIPKLLAVPARVRFLSMEPLLGPVDLTRIDINGHSEIYPLTGTTDCEDDDGRPAPDIPGIDWVIAGGESGPGARPMHPDWVRSLRDQCQGAGVPFLFKQWGEWAPTWMEAHSHMGLSAPPDPAGFDSIAGTKFIVGEYTDGRIHEELWPVLKVGKKAAGRLLEGRTWDQFPKGAA